MTPKLGDRGCRLRHPPDRTMTLITSCGAASLVLLLSACGRRATVASEFCANALADVGAYMTAQRGPQGEQYGGLVVVGTTAEMPSGMNSLVSSSSMAQQHQMFGNLMTLVRMDEAYELEPYLARSWEWNDDVTEVTFRLRDDVYWHDGVKTTARDVAFTYERAIEPETTFPNAAFWAYYDKTASGVQVVDSFTVTLRMQPHSEPLDPWRSTAILPSHLLEDVPPTELRQHPFGERCPVGNGPFRFVEHRQSESWTFEANPTFPMDLGGRPFVDRYVLRVIPEQTTLLYELLTQGIDVFIGAQPDHVSQIVESGALELISFPSRSYDFVVWNTRRAPLADSRVRQALTMATNRDEMVGALLQGHGVRADHGVPRFHWAHADQLDGTLPYDPEAARSLLEEAGWVDHDSDGVRENVDGTRLSISIKTYSSSRRHRDVLEIMQAELASVGVDVRAEVLEAATLIAQMESAERDFDGVIDMWTTEFKMDDRDLFHSSLLEERYQFSGIADQRLDRLLDTLQLIPERADARPVWRQFQERLIELSPYTYLFFPDRLAGVNRRVRGMEMDVRGDWVNISRWWIPVNERKYATGPVEREAQGRD